MRARASFFFSFFLLVHLYIWYSVIFLYRINNAMKNQYKKKRKKNNDALVKNYARARKSFFFF